MKKLNRISRRKFGARLTGFSELSSFKIRQSGTLLVRVEWTEQEATGVILSVTQKVTVKVLVAFKREAALDFVVVLSMDKITKTFCLNLSTHTFLMY